MTDRPPPGNPFANMGALFGLQDPSGQPADTRMLETIIGEITGQKRGYLTQKIKHYETQLRSDNDVVLMQTLTELNSDLTMTAEDQWIGQPLNETVQGVLNCLDMEFLPEVMIMASTCLINILEVSPESSRCIAENGGLERLGLKLMNNELTENIIAVLEKISQEYSNVILSSGVMEMLMNVIDFLVVQSQVSILKIVSRVFKSFSNQDQDLETKILPILPKIKEVLLNSDRTEEVSVEIYLNLTKRIAKLYETDREEMENKIDQVALQNDTLPFLMGLAERAIATPEGKAHNLVLNLFTIFNKFAYMSSNLSEELMTRRIDQLVLRCLDSSSDSLQGENSKMVMNEIISFINTLLSLNNYQNELFQKVFALAGIEIIKHYNTEKKVRFIEEHGELVKDLLSKIAKDCTTIYETNDDFFFKYLFLTALRKITMFLDSASMQGCVDQPIIANFISKTLDSTDIIITMITLFIIQSLVEKLPEIKRSLSRHGIIGCLKRLAVAENLQGHVVPEVSKKPDPTKVGINALLNDQLGRKLLLNHKKEQEDLLKQLQNWQNNPKSFEEGLNRMRNMDKPQIREGDEEPENEGEEEHDQENERTDDMDESKPEKSRRKGTEGIEEAQEEQRFDEESRSTSSPSRADQDLTSSMMIPEDIEPERMLLELKTKRIQSTIDRMREEPFGEIPPPHLKSQISTPMDIEKLESPFKSLPNSGAKVVAAKTEYSLQDAREDLARVAQETLDKIGADQSEVSPEFLELMRISNLLQKHDVEGLVQLNQFFAGELNMTFYEFSQADILKPIIEWFFNEGHAFEEVVKFLQGFFSTFYTNSSAGLEKLYSNLLEFIRRRPEVTPCFSNDQLARSSFVQELKFLSTPLKIKVSFNQGLARSFSREEFLMELTQEFPYLEMSTKEGLFQDVDKMLKWFKETFLSQSTVYLQVERFASLKSVEVYLIDKFGVKSLSGVSDEFAKKRAKENDDGHDGVNRRNPNDGDSESILTSGYLEKRLEEQMNFGKEKDIRRYFEKQYLRKPSKLIGIKFELKIQRADGGITRRTVSLNTTLHELLFILTKELPKKGVAVIELDYSVEVKTEIYHRGPKVKQEVPEHKSSLTVLYGDIKKKLEAFRAGMREVHIPEELQNIGLGLKLFIELDKLKARYIDGSASKVGQMIELDQAVVPTLGVKLTDHKLSTVYTKIFMKPSKILGQSFPQLSKILCVHVPELLDFNTRYYFFKHLQFEPTRAMYFIYQANKPAFKEIPGSKIGKLKRKKLKINRDQILEGARLTFSLSGFHTNVLEFDFEQEEGSGLGPTLEFYSLLAEDFKKRKEMWRNTDDFSYFPKPFTSKEGDQRSITSEINTWKILGAIVGRSVLDERIFDMRFSECFWKIVLGRRVSLTDLRPLNEGLMKTLSGMQALVNKYQLLLNKSPDDQQTFDKLHEELTYNGVKIEDLCLVFTLPGYEDYELIPGGIKKEVNLDNLELYVELVIKTYLVDSIMPYIEAFREGLSMFIALEKLDCFLPEEMEMVVCGTKLEPWSVEYLKENISPMHGFHQGSATFNNFLEVLSEFTEDQKREFLMFTIGAPRLPLGGLKNLSPRLTVVKKHPNNDRQSPDVILPSVMTCQNYIKLPDYSNKETLKRKLLVAMKEGQKSFTLS